MKQVKYHKQTESIFPFLHNQRDSETKPTQKTTTRNQLSYQNKTITSHTNHKNPNKTKRIQVIQQIEKSTIKKFKNLTKKSIFLRKNKNKLHYSSKHIETTKYQRISYNLRPRKQCTINSCESSDESANTSST